MLAVPALVYLLGEDVGSAVTTSLLVVGATALAGARVHAREGRVRPRVALAFGVAGAAGAVAGTALNRLAGGETILVLFGVVLLATAAAMWRGRRPRVATPASSPRRRAAVPLTGLGVGVLTGFFGVGGGFLIVPALTLVLGLRMPVAVGTSLLVISLVSAAALLAHLASGSVDWSVAVAFTAGGVAGAVAGARLAGRVHGRRLELAFAGLAAAVGAFLLAKNLGGLVA
jgi:uncharacterized membrane protein YfcA